MMCRIALPFLLLLSLGVLPGVERLANPLRAEEIASLTETIRRVKPDGEGSREAAKAWQQLAQADAQELVNILEAFDGAEPLAANWLRAAVDAIAERTLAHGGSIDHEPLEKFIRDRRHNPRARRLAYEWLLRFDDTTADRVLPDMLQDPSVEFRRDAVARKIAEADQLEKAGQNEKAIDVYRQALDGARDNDQIQRLTKQLRAMGEEVDLPTHFGFLMNWQVIGPFENSDRTGFETVFPPEKEIDFSAEYAGKEGTVRWQAYQTEDDYGMVDFNEPHGKLKEVTAYAWTDFVSDRQQDVELRLGCKNAFKVWLNGELLLARDEYHRGMKVDQYRMPATLKQGSNEILVKACQNEQMQSWTVQWQFQLRVCDATGTAILSQTRP